MKWKALVWLLSGLLLTTAALVIYGWVNNIHQFKSVLPDAVSMKVATALWIAAVAFVMVISTFERRTWNEVAVTVISLFIIYSVGLLSCLSAFELTIRVFTLNDETIFIASPHVPSVGTMLGMTLCACAGISWVFNTVKQSARLALLSFWIQLIGWVCVVGYIVNEPILYFQIPGRSTGVAIHSAVSLIACGLSVYCMSKIAKADHER